MSAGKGECALVPIEPTAAMIAAGGKAAHDGEGMSAAKFYPAVYRAMVGAAPRQQVGEVQGERRSPAEIAAILRAMASNYSSGHCWDHLDSKVCIQAADALAARQPLDQEPVAEVVQNCAGQVTMVFAEGKTVIDHVGAKLYAAPPAQAVDLAQYRDLIGFALYQAAQLPETDPRRDFIRQANDLVALIRKAVKP